MEEIQTNETEQLNLTDMLSGLAPDMVAAGHNAYVFTNDKTNPVPIYLLNTFFKGMVENKIGIAACKDKTTGKEELVIVGIVGRGEDDDSVDITPLALVIRQEDSLNFLPPDGNGGYLNDSQD